METARRWLQTLALVGLALAALLHVVGGRAAHAVAPPTCQIIDSRKLMVPEAKEDLLAQSVAFLSSVGPDRRIAVIPWGRGISDAENAFSVVCAY